MTFEDQFDAIRNQRHFLNVYCRHIVEQCEAALSSLTNATIQEEGPWNSELIFWSLDHVVNRAAVLSKMLWPVEESHFSKQRGAFLRKHLQVSDDNILNSRPIRHLRNALEHLDSRIDKWYQRRGIVHADRVITTTEHEILPGNPAGTIFRWFKRDRLSYSFQGNEIDLKSLKESIELILTAANKHNRVVKLGPNSEISF